LTVLLLFAQCKMHYWWLVTWFDLTVPLCTMHNELWVIDNCIWLDDRHQDSGRTTQNCLACRSSHNLIPGLRLCLSN
jgi:hypothetical protein